MATNTEILASGSTSVRSSTVTLESGASGTLIMRSAGYAATLAVEIQGSDSSWVTVGYLDAQFPAKQISGPGVYSVFRSSNIQAAAAADAVT